MCPENEDRAEFFNGDQVIFVNTELIQGAVAGLQRSREEFQALLDQAELGDLSAQYDLAMKYADGDGVDRDMATNIPGVFAAGDCTGQPLQISKAVGEGQVAGHRAAEYLDRLDREQKA